MLFGLHVLGHHSKERSPAENFEEIVEQVQTARDAGFDLLWCGHHYMVEEWQKFQVIPAISRFAADAGDMYVGTSHLLPLHHPIVIAEQFATIDAITGGRAIFGPVAGYRRKEFESLGIPRSERFGRLVEGVEVIKKLWREDDVTYDGRYFSFENVTINPKPVQEPRPPIWIGANADSAIDRASTLGDAWLINPHEDQQTIARQIERIQPPSGEGIHGVQPGRREVFVAETDKRALELYGPAVKEYYDWYDDVEQGEAMENPEALNMTLERLREDRFIIGSPETVADGLVTLYETVGLDAVLMAMQMPKLEHEDVLNSIELTGTEVKKLVEEQLSDANP